MNTFLDIIFPTVNSFYVFLGSLLLGASAGVLGCFAVLKRHGLMGDSLSHASLPGIAVAFLVMKNKFLPGLLLGAFLSSLIGAACISFLTSHTKMKKDTAMATILSVFFGIGIVLLTYIQKLPLASQAGLETFLFGQAASLLKQDVLFMGIILFFTLFIILLFWKELKVFTFDEQFARVLGFRKSWLSILFMTLFVIAIVISLQAVGVILTAALFITPASAALLWTNTLSRAVFLSMAFGMISGASGAFISTLFPKMPTGPVIVLFATLIFFLSFFLSPRRGVLFHALARTSHSRKIQLENILGRLYREYENGKQSWDRAEYAPYIPSRILLRRLLRRGYVRFFQNHQGASEKRASYCNLHTSAANASQLLAVSSPDTSSSLIQRFRSKCANFVTKSRFSEAPLELTSAGMQKAARIIEKHRLWETYLSQKMNIASDHLHRDAEDMEHLLDSEHVAELRKLLRNPKKDPHHENIPHAS